MNKKQYEKVKHLEDNLRTAVNLDYTRAIAKRDKDLLLLVYREIVDEPLVEVIHCVNCLMIVLKEVGKQFFEYKAKIEKHGKNNRKIQEDCSDTGMVDGGEINSLDQAIDS